MQPDKRYRVISEIEEIREVVSLQRAIWGEDSVTPLAQLLAVKNNGGVLIGAYDGERLVGFCYGFAGFQQGEAYLCSHMLGILPEYRDDGIGQRLKLEQRIWALQHGYQKMIWTFDPLEARNANLNLGKLGGYIRTYLPAYYGEMNDKINNGLPSDRFVLEWMLDSPRVKEAILGHATAAAPWSDYPIWVGWNQGGEQLSPQVSMMPDMDQEGYRVAVPRAIHELKKMHLDLALAWRYALRHALTQAFSSGYAITGFIRGDGPVHYYVLEKAENLRF
ncbi:GNAT family N-acetyltransferase [Brevibacillus ruminantium]|uniref:GNAT family N-acetyltransferase n=1 Tax=Brevibacillus ruminantium TaxID=2950604 RepID=A0ABY4WA30_9BACL|nr:GNAT family N-acetyltransferase [Brevibacillus ruminantium]USG64056.1 GNAT family N-acetyltransferase [Brevibacillus ruminantium]